MRYILFIIAIILAYSVDATAWGNGQLFPSGFITCGDCPKAKLEAFSSRTKFSPKAKYLPIDGKADAIEIADYIQIPRKVNYVWK